MTEDVIEEFLNNLAGKVTAATLRSYKVSIKQFVSYCDEHGIDIANQTTQPAAKHLIKQLESQSPSTVRGELSSIAVFLAYHWGKRPDIVRARIRTAMTDHVRTHDNISLEVFDESTVDDPMRDSIQTLLSYLRQSEFGTRAHLVFELIATEGLRVSRVRRLNTEDLDSSLDTLTLPSADKLSEAEPREVKLSQPARDALETYLRYTRVESVDENPEPLITTPAGRASLSTIRRDIRRTSQSVLNGQNKFGDEDPENTQDSQVELPCFAAS
ncbi:tyrosine-type recombinase/integrase [Halobellus marinus]|uniref:tyrosine-type recombinase/integrase n=1 Tax=Halobellus TaxID=1073986 RepID=UPI0028A8A13B|nr:hypothetical protein [Halobellus sp. DFY28]